MMHGVVYAFSSKGEKYLEAFNAVLAANTEGNMDALLDAVSEAFDGRTPYE